MAIRAVGQNEHSHIGTIVGSTAVGAGAGYALKYLYPITEQEKLFSNHGLTNYCHKETNKAKVLEFRELAVRTKAQDEFIRMIETGDKEAFIPKNITKKVELLGGESSVAGKEFRGIIRTVNEASAHMRAVLDPAFKIALKLKRPAVPFLVAGAGVGFLTGFTHNVLKADV